MTRLLTALSLLTAGTLLAALSGYMIAGWPLAAGVLWWLGAVYVGAAALWLIAGGAVVVLHMLPSLERVR